MNRCPRTASAFRASVNMRPTEIRAWARNPESREASFEATRRRLPALADLRAKSPADWTERDCRFAQRVVNFNTRMGGVVKQHGCARSKRAVIALRNWGRKVC